MLPRAIKDRVGTFVVTRCTCARTGLVDQIDLGCALLAQHRECCQASPMAGHGAAPWR